MESGSVAVVVAKFGGSSLADASQFKKVKDIIQADARRKFVVPSAPGKRFDCDEKVTDLLYAAGALAQEGKAVDEPFAQIVQRYVGIRDELGLSTDIESHLEQVRFGITNGQSMDYAASRGEYLNGILLADYLGFPFVDAAEVIFFDRDGRYDPARTCEAMSSRLAREGRAVVPGFYGSGHTGRIKTFSRGGSDVTGAIVAQAVKALEYENWTDVSGFLMADPRIVKDPLTIEVITYRELRELSYMGAAVLHDEAIFPVREEGIPIHIRNTNRPQDEGTMIVPTYEGKSGPITGTAGKTGFSAIVIEKAMMNSELGFGRRVLQVLEESKIPFEHMPSGIDTMSVLVQDRYLEGRKDDMLRRLRHAVHPDHIEVITGLALLATVGRGMVSNKGVAARLFGALSRAGINIRMIDQGSSELNIIVGMKAEDLQMSIQAIYDEFVVREGLS